MRDLREAKAMARSLRDALKAKAIETTIPKLSSRSRRRAAIRTGTFCLLRSKLPNRSQAMSDRFQARVIFDVATRRRGSVRVSRSGVCNDFVYLARANPE
jgi:hypothetical protein